MIHSLAYYIAMGFVVFLLYLITRRKIDRDEKKNVTALTLYAIAADQLSKGKYEKTAEIMHSFLQTRRRKLNNLSVPKAMEERLANLARGGRRIDFAELGREYMLFMEKES